ncbi:hypothetical protein [Hymenobacter swuensis]|uniref:Uncharacterized protein n=1 Tax=Hymenobacter swuensis DY53 TaxID=1227739 RepID=W8F068_9BACT|nr:hypothetical protein [Hymenobacter swuensis]AHJ97402.1 hypothetical protein Hsw_1807 [Hymenobacter swuensis DY53]
MRPVYLAATCAALLTGCQQKPAATAVSTTTATIKAVAAQPAPAAAPAVTVSALSAQELQFFREYSLAAIIAKEPDDHEVMNGFYGPDHYRIEFAMLEVRQDPANPAHYFVKGKNRFKKAITPFEGDILLTQLANQPPAEVPQQAIDKATKEYYKELNQRNAYSALGTFTLREDAGYKGAGVFRGEVLIDFSVPDEGIVELFTRNPKKNARGGGILFEGTWENPETQQQKPVLWVQNIFYYQQDIFRDFMIGERDPDFNPKYARLGWDTYWQNEEWWAEPGQVTAQEPEAAPDTATTISTSL